jgi:hypothetical protein
MTSSAGAAILPITLTVNGRIGVTLWAPPWEDEDGELWQGFLGDGAKILLFPSTRELASFIASGEENDLSDHPAWGLVQQLPPDELRPSSDDNYDLDGVYEWASGDPDPVHVSALADVVDMVGKIADSCDDGALRRLIEGTPAYAELVDEDVSYQGKDGRRRWNELGDTIAETWERAMARVESWLSWRGDFSTSNLGASTIWERVGAEPIEMRLPDARFLTVRGYLPAETEDEGGEAVFLGVGDTVSVFRDVSSLAAYCRSDSDTRLHKLEWWDELREVDDDELFTPGLDASYDLRRPSSAAAELLRELVAFCNLDLDVSLLDSPSVDRDDWRDLVAEVRTCFEPED